MFSLRAYSKFVCVLVFFLVFAGSLVTSHDAGLAVPDWPTSYGYSMFEFPIELWQGGIFYEHFHRLFASIVGLFTLFLIIGVFLKENRRSVRLLALMTGIILVTQGLLGGLTVLYLLPDWTSIAHGMLGQIFFILIFCIAYSQSRELNLRSSHGSYDQSSPMLAAFLLLLVFAQLFIGAWVRHSGAGLAIPDFPTMGGDYSLVINQAKIDSINNLRTSLSLPVIGPKEAHLHMTHRIFGALIVLYSLICGFKVIRSDASERSKRSIFWITLLVGVQFTLGAITVVSGRSPLITSLHVLTGALLLAACTLFFLRNVNLGRRTHIAAERQVFA